MMKCKPSVLSATYHPAPPRNGHHRQQQDHSAVRCLHLSGIEYLLSPAERKLQNGKSDSLHDVLKVICTLPYFRPTLFGFVFSDDE